MKSRHAGANELERWESKIYGKGKQMNKYVWGEVYYYTNRYFLSQYRRAKGLNVLELGCGAGNNLSFFAELGMNVYGIEGSSTACAEARKRLKRFKNIKSEVICGNFCESPLPWKSGFFDLILDRGSITHNVYDDIKTVIGESHRMLKRGGRVISIHFFSDSDPRCGLGKKIERGTYKNPGGREFADVPLVHFTNVKEILTLYRRFDVKFVEERSAKRFFPYKGEEGSSFDLVAAKGAAPRR